MSNNDLFQEIFHGHFTSILSWPELDEFWEIMRREAHTGWYIYAIGVSAPIQTSSAKDVIKFIDEVNQLLRDEHDEDYCGIVYADDKNKPTFVKIFDPYNLGVSCGFSDDPPLPGWILSRIPPQSLKTRRPLPERRRRWWQGLRILA